jgi:hypothetical protein
MASRSVWRLALAGLALAVFAVVGLSGPGRLDIVDGEARYEVARAIYERGEIALDPALDFRWSFLPGREGRWYSVYRLPQSLLGLPALALADLTRPPAAPSEPRRRFFFLLEGAVLAAAFAALAASWFRERGLAPRQALAWAALGVVATPVWYYGTSSFDDLGGGVFAVAALLAVERASRRDSGRWLAVSALALFVAVQWKQPLAVFALPLCGRLVDGVSGRRRGLWVAWVVAAALASLGSLWAFEGYKFPPSSRAATEAARADYLGPHPGDPLAALASFAVSPAAGAFWYGPALLLGVVGVFRQRRESRSFAAGLAGAALVFITFLATLAFAKGDPAWGPRYLTPWYAVGWLFVPDAARRWPQWATVSALFAAIGVQILALSVDPARLYAERGLSSTFYVEDRWAYFDPARSHLVQRPREIAEIWSGREQEPAAERFSNAAEPTRAMPVVRPTLAASPDSIRRWGVFRTFRPWWASQGGWTPAERPVDPRWGLAGFSLLLVASGCATWVALRRLEAVRPAGPSSGAGAAG